MAQLNPNFEIDFSDINSYEQIQLINDAQLARENLLMHRAYREPSDDEVIRNNYSSYTFIDFRPRIFAAKSLQNSRHSTSSSRSPMMSSSYENCADQLISAATSSGDIPNNGNHSPTTSSSPNDKPAYELEKFSDIFERINIWLKLNKEWQAVSVETLYYDSVTQFNYTKSSTYSEHMPRNTRGIRLHLCPFKSRFSGPQKIGCINVVPRRLKAQGSDNQSSISDLSDSEKQPTQEDEASKYENLDQILARLNELLLTRPIQGRILSVETITMPIINGQVDFENNYISDSRLNLLKQFTNCSTESRPPVGCGGDSLGNCLVDILRVYYEFGPMVCGLVNLIDYVPRFYSPTELRDNYADAMAQDEVDSDADQEEADESEQDHDDSNADHNRNRKDVSDAISVNVNGQNSNANTGDTQTPEKMSPTNGTSDHNETAASCYNKLANGNSALSKRKSFATESLTRLIRRSLAWFEEESRRVLEASPNEVLNNTTATGTFDEDEPFNTNFRSSVGNGDNAPGDNHLKLRLCNIQVHHKTFLKGELYNITPGNILGVFQTRSMIHQSKADLISSHEKSLTNTDSTSLCAELTQPYDVKFVRLAYVLPIYDRHSGVCTINKWGLNVMRDTNERHLRDELAHQAGQGEADKLNESPIGQLSYRLFTLSSPASGFATNEFESVEAIRKRMEIYVTTNSMKVLAGETLIVNLSSNLSCLSNAIEQTVVRSSFARTKPSTWVSVYILYAAVDEPLMPSQLLAQQKLRELTLINGDAGNADANGISAGSTGCEDESSSPPAHLPLPPQSLTADSPIEAASCARKSSRARNRFKFQFKF